MVCYTALGNKFTFGIPVLQNLQGHQQICIVSQELCVDTGSVKLTCIVACILYGH